MRTLGLYVHVPFCVRKCNYCDFLSMPASEENRQKYIQRLVKEIAQQKSQYMDYHVDSIFFGGGTPSILSTSNFTDIMMALRDSFAIDDQAEISIECNPGTVDYEKLKCYKDLGVNRLSFGLQSTDDEELKILGRIHSYEEFLESFNSARKAGFDNINVDLMTSLPGQTYESFEINMERICKLSPEHLSIYSLIIEEGTMFYKWFEEEKGVSYPVLPDEDEDRKIYHLTKEYLQKYGYERYEISNYAKKNRECKHNIKYWNRSNYLGFGLGAASMVENRRWQNTSSMKEYLEEKEWILDIEVLTKEDCMSEFMFLGLRMIKGVSEKEFRQLFGISMRQQFGKYIDKWIKNGLLCQQGDYIKLTEQGIDVSNMVMSDFV